ncbi:hypothetical protein AUR64_16630 [Haloprofundus marisrubri]|uniref:Sulfatase N-terminal domain-containing protein n=1 Tax=Haloprofundus marisrubri TaxID=1514971 RepID=A0A0W1R7K1_9EURY|nr:sulfatase-like hydrolase/transferase [Haloprofundus marisrubri]KTG09403.1 hypothetical protein AUR64_16630 [Haloprofundus marisrubri]
MPRNVVVLCLDTVRKDFFDRFAPRLQERADVTFEQCRAASGWSVPSHASMLTGELPSEHGATAFSPRLDALETEDTFVGDLSEHRSLGISTNVYAGSAYGFDAHFDDFLDVTRDRRRPEGLDVAEFIADHDEPGIDRYLDIVRAALDHDKPAASLYNAIALQLDSATRNRLPTPFDDGAKTVRRELRSRLAGRDDPTVAFCNLMEGHEPHRDTLGYDRTIAGTPLGWSTQGLKPWHVVGDVDDETETKLQRYRGLYAASVDYLDQQVAALVDDLLALDRETTVVITADHGENLGTAADGGLLGHVGSLSEGVLHVPLLLVNPPEGYDDVESELVSHLSLRRLIRGLGRDETPDVTTDVAPAELLGLTPGNDPLVDIDSDRFDRSIRCAYREKEKYEWDNNGSVVHYDLVAERPGWQREVESETESEPPTWATDPFDESVSTARERAKAAASDDGPTGSVERRLRDLGYV